MSTDDLSGERLARAARAAHDLGDVLWESLHAELATAPDPQRAALLARRLADVCSTIALIAEGPTPTAEREPAAEPASTAHPQTPLEPPEPPPAEGAEMAGIEIHDTRPHEERAQERAGSSAWIGAIERRLLRHHEDRLPFAVLLVEVVDIDRLAQAETPAELERLTDHLERAIAAELRPADLFTRESLGRYWLVTPETDTPGARHLAERLAGTVRLSARHRGVPLEVAIGIAVCPQDGRDADTLAAHADVGVYAARAAGQSLAPGSGDDPAVA